MEEEDARSLQSEQQHDETVDGIAHMNHIHQALDTSHGFPTHFVRQRPSSVARTYDSVQVAGNASAIFGDVHGGVHYHIRPRLGKFYTPNNDVLQSLALLLSWTADR